jgi:hypothetical protein
MVTWECDYPHSDCTWPGSPEVFHEQTKHLTDAQINKIGHLNAMREFSYDPFAILGSRELHRGRLAQAGRQCERPNRCWAWAVPGRSARKASR